MRRIEQGADEKAGQQKHHRFGRGCLRCVAALVLLAAGGLYYALRIEPRWIMITRVEIPIDGLSPHLDGFTIAHLSDLHLGPHVDSRQIRRAVGLTNDLNPDLIVLTGDFVSRSASYAKPCAQELSRLEAPYGVYAITGNHDEWTDDDMVSAELRQVGIHVLRNQVSQLRVGTAPIWLVGIDDAGVTGITGARGMNQSDFADLWAEQRDAYRRLLASLPPGELVILLVHNPDFVETVSLKGISLALCGHTHGGQIRLPILGPLVLPSLHGQKYAGGLTECEGILVYVNRGIGLISPPLRFLCRPEITLLRLTAN